MTLKEPLSEFWRCEAARCVAVLRGHHVELELLNAEGTAFFRKSVPTRQAAMRESEGLRELVGAPDWPAPGGSLRPFALVIEDDRNGGFPVADALRASGMRAIACPSGAEAVVLARDLLPDLIVLDSVLSDVSMADVYRMILADPITAPLPIVALATPSAGLRDEGAGLHILPVNSYRTETLRAAVRQFVGQTMAPGAPQ